MAPLPTRSVAAILLTASLVSCGHHAALDAPGLHQGVIEHDDRVLAFELAGTVRAVLSRQGTAVAAGQEVAELDDELERATLTGRQADARAAEAAVALLRAGSRAQDIAAADAQAHGTAEVEALVNENFLRATAVSTQAALSQSDVDLAHERLANAHAEHLAAEARLSALREGPRPEEIARAEAQAAAAQAAVLLEEQRLARHHLRSPIPGRVVTVDLEAGESSTPGRPVLTVADTTHPYVDAFVPQAQMAGLAVGAKAEVVVDGEAQAFAAVIEDIGRSLEFTPRYLFSPGDRPNLVMRVRVRIADPGERLIAGVPAGVRFAAPTP